MSGPCGRSPWSAAGFSSVRLRTESKRDRKENFPVADPFASGCGPGFLPDRQSVLCLKTQMRGELWLIRHGETKWSLSGQHTGRTDIPLTDGGRANAAALGRYLAGRQFALVLTSPLERARETCALAGFGAVAQIDPDLCEWNYGDYEGRTTAEIHLECPDWFLWTDGVPNGESIQQVAARADAVIARATQALGDVALFAHGHLLRILTARWLALDPSCGRLFALSAGSLSTLGYEHDTRVIDGWNLKPSV
jgi:broad specificity phosphatase PhoE